MVSHGDARERVRCLAAGAGAAGVGDRPRLADRLRGPQHALDATYRRLAGGATGANRQDAEWLLDNYYIVQRAFQFVREEFPLAFERRLPRSPAGEPPGLPVAFTTPMQRVSRQRRRRRIRVSRPRSS